MHCSQGASTHHDSTHAARGAAQQAIKGLPEGAQIGWALVFAGGHQDADQLLATIRSEVGGAPVYGGSVVGTIHKEAASYTHFEVLVTLFTDDLMPTAVHSAPFTDGEYAAGQRIGAALGEEAQAGSAMLMFYDSVESVPPPKLYVGGKLLDGLYEGLGAVGESLDVCGGGLVGDLQMANSFIFAGDAVLRHGASGVLLPPAISATHKIMHGCTPISAPMEITGVDKNCVFEIDGRPALDVVLETLGADTSEASLKRVCLGVSVGKNYGEIWDDYDESNYVVRLLVAAVPDNGSIILFDDDYSVGSSVELMSRDNQKMVESARAGTRSLCDERSAENNLFALYVNCAGRSTAWNGHHEEEADVVRDEFTASVPLMGAYTGVEFTPVHGRSRAADWNGVLTMFSIDTGA